MTDFALLVRAAGLPEPEREHRFCERRWRFDWAWPERMVAVELEGGIWTNGRHTRATGYQKDIEKYNTAVLLGWKLIRFTYPMLRDDPAACIETVRRALMLDEERQ